MGKKQENKAGKLTGWFLGRGIKKRQFEDLVDFPCDFTFKIIGQSSADFKTEVLEAIERHGAKKVVVINAETKPSRQKKYVSLTLTLHVTDSEDICAVYDACEKIPQIKFVL